MFPPRPHHHSPEWSRPLMPPAAPPPKTEIAPPHVAYPGRAATDGDTLAPPDMASDVPPPQASPYRALGAFGMQSEPRPDQPPAPEISVHDQPPSQRSADEAVAQRLPSLSEAAAIPHVPTQSPLEKEVATTPDIDPATRQKIEDTARKYAKLDDAKRIPFAHELHAKGSTATEVLLESMRRDSDNGDFALPGLAVCVTQADTARVADYLGDMDDARPASWLLFYSVLGRVADSSALPGLRAYVSKASSQDPYSWQRAAQALELAENRLVDVYDADERAAWTAAKEEWEPLVPAAYDTMNPVHPEERALRHAQRFVYDDRNDRGMFRPADFASPQERVDQLERVYTALSARHPEMPRPEALSAVEERIRTQEASVPPHTITIGAEIEVTRASAVLRRDHHEPPDARAERQLTRLEDFRVAEEAGIPMGVDELWEFAHDPTRHNTTLLREIQTLAAADVLNMNQAHLPLHVTLNEIGIGVPGGAQTLVLARALEATGWSTTGDRLRDPLTGQGGSWSSPEGPYGVRQRLADHTQGDSQQAIELRTLEVNSLSGTARTLNSAQALGSALAAHQAIAQNTSPPTETQRQLTGIWQSFAAEVGPLFVDLGMDHPARQPWIALYDRLTHNTDLDDNFLRLADVLDEARDDRNSPAAVFQDAIQRAVIRHRAAAWRILYGQTR